MEYLRRVTSTARTILIILTVIIVAFIVSLIFLGVGSG
jgi:hypothetical protein